MKRWLYHATIVAVTGLGLLMLPVRSEAQRGGRGGGGGRGGAVGGGRAGGGFRDGGFRAGGFRDGGFRDGGFRDGGFRGDRFGIGIGLGGWGWGGGWAYGGWGGPGYVYDYSPGYVTDYYPGTTYYAPGPSYVYDEAPAQGYISGYQGASQPSYATEAGEESGLQGPSGNVAHVTIRVPPDATLWFNGARMLAQGGTRTFTTPPLEPGQDYHYNVKVRYMKDGKAVTVNRVLNVRAGANENLNLTRAGAARHEGDKRGAVRDEQRRTDGDRNRQTEDLAPPVEANPRPRDNRRPANGNRPNDVNRPGANPPATGTRNSDTNGRSQPNRNPADSNTPQRPGG